MKLLHTPKKPEGVDHKSAYIIGSGLAALTAACYLVRDGQMKGEHVHMFEKDPIWPAVPAMATSIDIGYVMRGGREMDNHFEVMWDLLHSIPSLETEGASVLDEYYWLNKEDPNFSLCRATVNRGEDAHTDGKFGLSDKGAMEIMKLFFTPDEQLQDKKITDFFDDEVLNTNFWLYWRTMFAFENWHSALEMKLYLKRYIHHIGGLPDFTALRFTRYNQYESIILPMVQLPGRASACSSTTTPRSRMCKFDIQNGPQAGKLRHRGARRARLRDHRPDRERSAVHHQRRLRGKLHRGRTEQGRRLRPHHPARQRLGSVEEDRRTGSLLRSPGKVLLRAGAEQLGERYHHHAGR